MRCYLYIFFTFIIAILTSCSNKRLLPTYYEDRYLQRIERKEKKYAERQHKKDYVAWFKLQAPEVKQRLREQRKSTKKFYKKYGKATMNFVPIEPARSKNHYRKNGLK